MRREKVEIDLDTYSRREGNVRDVKAGDAGIVLRCNIPDMSHIVNLSRA